MNNNEQSKKRVRRFTDTMKWDNKGFRKLSPEEKLLFLWLCDKCDLSGVVEWDDEAAEFETKLENVNAILDTLICNGASIQKEEDKLWLKNHIEVQGNNDMTPKNNIYKPFYDAVSRNSKYFAGLADILKELPSPLQGASKALGREYSNSNSNSNSGSKSKSEEYNEEFLEFWDKYPRKTGKGKAWESWLRVKPVLEDCLATLEWQTKSHDWIKDNGSYIPMPTTWLNQRRWEDSCPNAPKRCDPTSILG